MQEGRDKRSSAMGEGFNPEQIFSEDRRMELELIVERHKRMIERFPNFVPKVVVDRLLKAARA